MRITHVAAHNWRNFKNVDFAGGADSSSSGPTRRGSRICSICSASWAMSPAAAAVSPPRWRSGAGCRRRAVSSPGTTTGANSPWRSIWPTARTRYELAVKGEQGGRNRPIIVREIVTRNGQPLLSRPDDRDERDRELLTQTHLEQISANQGFRPIAEYFAKVNYGGHETRSFSVSRGGRCSKS